MAFFPRLAGFANAPVSRTVILLTLFASCGLILGVDIPASLRTVLLPFTFRSPSELFFGLVLLYHFRVLERQLGSVNFSIFLAVSFVNSEFLTAAIAYVKSIKRTSLTFGPYTAIFALLTFYYFEIPATYHRHYDLFGYDLPITDKWIVYGFAWSLLSGGLSMIGTWIVAASSLTGTLTGLLLLARGIGGFASAP